MSIEERAQKGFFMEVKLAGCKVGQNCPELKFVTEYGSKMKAHRNRGKKTVTSIQLQN
jgi:hypothetical protein